jgi:chromosome segregation ATPase
MKKLSRKQQIFLACDNLAEDGAEIPDDVTIINVQKSCEKLGFAKGNTAYLTKYRNEWLAKIDKTDDHSMSNTLSSPMMHSALDEFLSQQEQSLSSHIKEQFESQFDSLRQQRDKARHELEQVQWDLENLKHMFDSQQTKIETLVQLNSEQNRSIESLSAQKACVEYECSIVNKQLDESHKTNGVNVEKIKKNHQQLIDSSKEQLTFVQRQLQDEQYSHDKTRQSLLDINKEQSENHVQTLNSLNSQIKKMSAANYQLQADNNQLSGKNDAMVKLNDLLSEKINKLLSITSNLATTEHLQQNNQLIKEIFEQLQLGQNEMIQYSYLSVIKHLDKKIKQLKIKLSTKKETI